MEELKQKAIKSAIDKIQKNFGKGSIYVLGEKEIEPIEAISTGSMSIDKILGIGGVPKGRITEIYGPESSGKTTLALQIVAEAQKNGGVAAFIDAEHALDINYAQKLGCDVENLIVSQPDFGEQALEILDTLIKTGAIDVVVVDSVAALTPKAEIDGDMGDSHIGLQARMMSQALRKITASASQTNTTVIFINQTRMKIGVMGYGNPETTTGGNALKFYSSVRIETKPIGTLKKGDTVVGKKTRVKIVKNKVAPPFREAELEVRFGEGFSKYAELLNLAVKEGIVDKAGSWFSYEDRKLGQGADKVIEHLKENPELLEEIREKLKSKGY